MATTTIDRSVRDLDLCNRQAAPMLVDLCVQPGCLVTAQWRVDEGRELCTRHAARRIRRSLRFGGAR